MKLPSLIGAAGLSVLCMGMVRADPTAPLDPAQRNTPFAPAATVIPNQQTPALNEAVQARRVEKNTIEKATSALGDRRAAIDVQEAHTKNIRDKQSSRPEAIDQTLSAFNHREAPFATATDTTRPSLVAKFQDGLHAASATNMARFPAIDRATTAKLNRFVFRKNAPDPAPITGDATVTPAAGGSPVRN